MTPAPAHLHLGGMATVNRYREGLQNCGHLCELFGGADEGGLKQSLEGTIGRFNPDIVHAHDAYRCGTLSIQRTIQFLCETEALKDRS